MCVDHCRDGIGRIVKSVDELESQRYQQGKAKQEIRQNRSVVDTRQIRRQAGAGIYDADDHHNSEGKELRSSRDPYRAWRRAPAPLLASALGVEAVVWLRSPSVVSWF